MNQNAKEKAKTRTTYSGEDEEKSFNDIIPTTRLLIDSEFHNRGSITFLVLIRILINIQPTDCSFPTCCVYDKGGSPRQLS